jgi:hypothetical protein
MAALHGPLATSEGYRLFSTDGLWVGLQVRRGVRADRTIQRELGAFSFSVNLTLRPGRN